MSCIVRNTRIACACVLLMYCFMHFVHRMLFALMPQRAKYWDAERNRILMKWILGGVSWDSAKQKSKHTLVKFQIKQKGKRKYIRETNNGRTNEVHNVLKPLERALLTSNLFVEVTKSKRIHTNEVFEENLIRLCDTASGIRIMNFSTEINAIICLFFFFLPGMNKMTR